VLTVTWWHSESVENDHVTVEKLYHWVGLLLCLGSAWSGSYTNGVVPHHRSNKRPVDRQYAPYSQTTNKKLSHYMARWKQWIAIHIIPFILLKIPITASAFWFSIFPLRLTTLSFPICPPDYYRAASLYSSSHTPARHLIFEWRFLNPTRHSPDRVPFPGLILLWQRIAMRS
jgi:hypothetical protein